MKYVDIASFGDEGLTLLYRVKLIDGKIEIENKSDLDWKKNGLFINDEFVRDRHSQLVSMKKEPEKFLKNIRTTYGGTYFGATPVLDSDEIPFKDY